jgi:5-methylcytosine-specific restriction endonuclease McrA
MLQIHQTSQRGNIMSTDTIYFEIDKPNTLASYLMLKDYYKIQAEKSSKAMRFRLINASRTYLTALQNKYGKLYCTYCGKPDLVIELEGMKVGRNIMATIDHIEAKSKGGALLDPKNFTCACGKCNGKKNDLDILTFLGY